MGFSVSILGARGSIPVSGPAFARYGGATTCVLAESDGQFVAIDAGTGLCALPPAALAAPALCLILTHTHADHLIGLGMCPYLARPGARLTICMADRSAAEIRDDLSRLFSPPLWPVTLSEMAAEVVFASLSPAQRIGPFRVDTMPGVHPGGVSVVRLRAEGRSMVMATDCTITDGLCPALEDFSRGCDLLLCDGQYSPDEWPARQGFGHNTWIRAASFGRDCAARSVRIIHHDPAHTDDILDEAERQAAAVCPRCALAREGEVIDLTQAAAAPARYGR